MELPDHVFVQRVKQFCEQCAQQVAEERCLVIGQMYQYVLQHLEQLESPKLEQLRQMLITKAAEFLRYRHFNWTARCPAVIEFVKKLDIALYKQVKASRRMPRVGWWRSVEVTMWNSR